MFNSFCLKNNFGTVNAQYFEVDRKNGFYVVSEHQLWHIDDDNRRTPLLQIVDFAHNYTLYYHPIGGVVVLHKNKMIHHIGEFNIPIYFPNSRSLHIDSMSNVYTYMEGIYLFDRLGNNLLSISEKNVSAYRIGGEMRILLDEKDNFCIYGKDYKLKLMVVDKQISKVESEIFSNLSCIISYKPLFGSYSVILSKNKGLCILNNGRLQPLTDGKYSYFGWVLGNRIDRFIVSAYDYNGNYMIIQFKYQVWSRKIHHCFIKKVRVSIETFIKINRYYTDLPMDVVILICEFIATH